MQRTLQALLVMAVDDTCTGVRTLLHDRVGCYRVRDASRDDVRHRDLFDVCVSAALDCRDAPRACRPGDGFNAVPDTIVQ
jgi:hypothetical protein